jgi:hypothetical protein
LPETNERHVNEMLLLFDEMDDEDDNVMTTTTLTTVMKVSAMRKPTRLMIPRLPKVDDQMAAKERKHVMQTAKTETVLPIICTVTAGNRLGSSIKGPSKGGCTKMRQSHR